MIAANFYLLYWGMVGLSMFLIEHRTKEIGIRKINGASVSEVMKNAESKILVKWVVIALCDVLKNL